MAEQSQPDRLTVILAIAIIVAIAWFVARNDDGPSAPADTTNITGNFVEWQAVDDARGYALFTVTNHGSSTAEATCTITVRNDFGNFGVDVLSGETIKAGATRNLRLAMSVGEGSFLINSGEVTDC